jgi:hypothetical protein
MEFFNGQVMGVCKVTVTWDAGPPPTITDTTPVEFCQAVLGGTFSAPFNDIQKAGLGGQWHSRKGTQLPTLRFRCVGPALADIERWFPDEACVQVADFPDFLVVVDDGAAGMQFVLSDGQPVACKISLGEGDDAEVEYEFEMQFATVTQQAVATDAVVYNELLNHTRNDCTVQFDAADFNVLSWQLTNGLTLGPVNACNTKLADHKTFPVAFGITGYKPSFSATVSNLFNVDDWDADVDTAADITIALANGVPAGAEDITYTLHDFTYMSPEVPLEPEGIASFPVEFLPYEGQVYGRVTLA